MSDRREFFRKLARGAAGVLLVGGTGWMTLKSGKPCWADGGCRGCPELDGCEEAEARIARLQRSSWRSKKGPERPEQGPGS